MLEADSRATRPSLLLRLRDASDSDSWEDFARVYGPVIRGYCRRRGLQQADADDVVQEVLGQVAQSIGTFEYEPERGRFRDWLGTVTRHKIARWAEARGRAAAANFSDGELAARGDDPAWSDEFYARVLEAALARIRGEFEPRTWDAFERVWAGDRPAPQVAVALGMTIDAVYQAKSRVLKRLREEVLTLAEDLPVALAPPPGDAGGESVCEGS
jgi:RNA polymerase sigma-70 factor (ECF subfamily)